MLTFEGVFFSFLKEKLSSLGSSGILVDHQLQMQLQEHHLKGQGQLTISDIARKAFLHSRVLSLAGLQNAHFKLVQYS
ncbi:hypothetical protein IFM89_030056 [Coptis chinensis]|uniref:Uncharacterized protein n=1 Tax=Coptis chinensis TaxID=261450 RepID=A0A835IV73_9MAGN|nr:hypothetical protein IFM89_030056 [Coptis chinensis]